MRHRTSPHVMSMAKKRLRSPDEQAPQQNRVPPLITVRRHHQEQKLKRLAHKRQALEGRQAEARIWLQLTDRSDLERVGAAPAPLRLLVARKTFAPAPLRLLVANSTVSKS